MRTREIYARTSGVGPALGFCWLAKVARVGTPIARGLLCRPAGSFHLVPGLRGSGGSPLIDITVIGAANFWRCDVAQVMAAPVFDTTVSAVQQKRKLRRHFRRFDIFFYLICTVVTLDTVGDDGKVLTPGDITEDEAQA
jgi:hypothetical protein